MSTKQKSAVKPLPLADVLRDLAVLRASGVDIPENLVKGDGVSQDSTPADVAASVSNSYQFTQASRAAIKLHDSSKVESEGSKIETIRNKSEDMLNGLET